MKRSIILLAVFGIISTVVLACAAFIDQDQLPRSITRFLPYDSDLKSFEFLGCSGTGDFSKESLETKTWLAGRKFLIRHPATCGYGSGNHPKALIQGSSIELSYELVSEDGMLAACYCEYWVIFETKSLPEKILGVSLNGQQTQLMGKRLTAH